MLFENMDWSKMFDMRDELLLDSRNCMKTVAYTVEDTYSTSKQEEIARGMLSHQMMDQHEASEFMRINELYKEVWRNNVRIIVANAESPLMTRFLNAFNIFCVLARFSQLVFTEPYTSISQKMNDYRKGYENFLEAKKIYVQAGGPPQHFIQTIDALNVVEEIKEFYKYCQMVRSYLFEEFHISIHSTIEELVIQGECIRPDIFIWMPKKTAVEIDRGVRRL